jgi:hypothetical protein
MKDSTEYTSRAIEFLERCELESPYKNVVDIEQAKRALEIVELEHKIEEARQLHHYDDMEEYKKQIKSLMERIQ